MKGKAMSKEENPRKKKLAELQAKLNEVAPSKSEDELLDAEIERVQREIDIANRVKEVSEKHGEPGKAFAYVTTPDGAVFLKKPSGTAFKAFQDIENPRTNELLGFIQGHLLEMTVAQFKELFDKWPAILVPCSEALASLAGVGQVAYVGKSKAS